MEHLVPTLLNMPRSGDRPFRARDTAAIVGEPSEDSDKPEQQAGGQGQCSLVSVLV